MSTFSFSDLLSVGNIIDNHDLKKNPDGYIENYGDFATASRQQINNLAVNGTDIPAILAAHVGGVVGSGINIQGANQDKEVNEAFETLLKVHNRPRNFAKNGRYSRNEGFRLAERFKQQHGGVLIKWHYGKVSGAEIPFTIELIEIGRIDTSKNDRKYTKNGIQTDTNGRITYIWLFGTKMGVQSKRYSMKDMTYYAGIWIDLSQYTAVSELTTVLSTIAQKDEYMEAELQSAIDRARSGILWSTELYDVITDAVKERLKAAGNPAEGIAEFKTIMNDLAARGVKPNGLTPIPSADKIHELDNKTDSVVDTFSAQTQKSIASATGGSAISTYKDVALGNYASIKAAISFDEEQYKIGFDQLKENIIEEYLERLYMVGVQTNAIPVTRSEYFANRFSYHKWDILRVSKRSVDEKNDASARKMNLEMGATTRVIEYANMGRDYKDVARQQAVADADIAVVRAEIFAARGIDDPLLMVCEDNTDSNENDIEGDEDE